MGKKVAIGIQNFEDVRDRNALYIDKTDFIREWWESGDDVTLITRPRRFGKTLNLSMLECFFSNQYAGRADLFEGLSIWEKAQNPLYESYRQLQGTFPVIFLSFARIKADDETGMQYAMGSVIFEAFQKNRFLLEGSLLSQAEKEYFNSIQPRMEKEKAAQAIHSLSHFLKRYYNRRVIILLDEYDTPMQEAWLSGYWEQAVSYFRSFFNAVFKTNPYMQRALITGITRISKESIFSDFNNPEVITTTSEKYAAFFGFTQQEVSQALCEMGLESEQEGVKRWYDGFTFGSIRDIYNPWSILNFIGKNGQYDAYWADSSSDGLIRTLVQNGSVKIRQTMEQLMQGESFTAAIEEQVVFDQLEHDENAVWSLLLATGYLKVVHLERKGRFLKKIYTLRLTNMEVESMFAAMIDSWFRNTTKVYNEFIHALLHDDVKKMNLFMNRAALYTFSFYDSGKKLSHTTWPERFYHGFVLGMVVDLADRYRIRSNRESGYGRYDVMIEPYDKTQKAFIFEFKVLDKDENETALEETVASALAQIEEKQYEAELIADGIAKENIRKYGFAFEGKKCLIGGSSAVPLQNTGNPKLDKPE